MKQTDRIALQNWEKFKDNIARATPVDRSMSQAEIQKHRAWLEARPLEWIKFFFPNFAQYEFAPFQKRAIRRILSNPEWFEVISWSRELAKSTCAMFCIMFLTLTGRKRNVILTSNSFDNVSDCSTRSGPTSRPTGASSPTTESSSRSAHGRRTSSSPSRAWLSVHSVQDSRHVAPERMPSDRMY